MSSRPASATGPPGGAVPSDPIIRLGRLLAITTAVICVVPVPLVVVVATSRTWQQGFWGDGFTTQWVIQAWDRIAPQLGTSLRIATLTVVIDLAIGLPAAWALARHHFPGRSLLLGVSVVPIAIPGIALALALILSYPTLRPGGWLLQGGHVLYTLPFLLGALVPPLSRPELRELEGVAASLGAPLGLRLWAVTLPQVRSALLAAVLLVFTLSMGEFNVSFFLFTPTDQPLPVKLYDGYITGRIETAAATTVWFLLFVVPAAAVLERQGGARVGQA